MSTGSLLNLQIYPIYGQTRIGFEPNANKIYVPVRVNNTGPSVHSGHRVDFQCGDTDTAKGLGMTLRDPFEASGAGEKTITGAVGSNVSLNISELELRQAEIDVEPVNAAISARPKGAG